MSALVPNHLPTHKTTPQKAQKPHETVWKRRKRRAGKGVEKKKKGAGERNGEAEERKRIRRMKRKSGVEKGHTTNK